MNRELSVSTATTVSLSVECFGCKEQIAIGDPRTVVVICQCGTGARVRVRSGEYLFLISVARLEPPDEEAQAKSCGALAPGARDSRGRSYGPIDPDLDPVARELIGDLVCLGAGPHKNMHELRAKFRESDRLLDNAIERSRVLNRSKQ